MNPGQENVTLLGLLSAWVRFVNFGNWKGKAKRNEMKKKQLVSN